MRYRDFFIESTDYCGEHGAPDKTSGSPMHNLTDTYPNDIYTADAVRLYGTYDGNLDDQMSIGIIRMARERPRAAVKIYRAVPKVESRDDKILNIENQKRYIQKRGKVPSTVETNLSTSKYYELLCNALDKLNASPPDPISKKIGINNGDWVTINRNYAVEHGRDNLGGKYKILSKTVAAKHLFTDGNSIHEWGYDAS